MALVGEIRRLEGWMMRTEACRRNVLERMRYGRVLAKSKVSVKISVKINISRNIIPSTKLVYEKNISKGTSQLIITGHLQMFLSTK